MGGASMQDMQRLQQQLAQAQYQRQQQTPGGQGSGSGQLVGAGNGMNSQQFPAQFSSPMSQSQNRGGSMGNTALAMMQQQQQTHMQQANQQQQGAGNSMQGSGMASMFGSFGSVNQALRQGNSSSPMDASTGSSARLMAMAGMNVNQMNSTSMSGMTGRSGSMDNSSTMQNMQAIMQQQQVQQAAVQKNQLQNSMGFGMQAQPQSSTQQMFNQSGTGSQSNLMMRSSDGGTGNQMNSQQMMLQQQLASLQQQMQGQQQNGMNHMTNRQEGHMMRDQNSSQNLLQQRQQQLLQQMQNQRRSSGMMNQQMTQGGLNVQQQQQHPGQDMNNMGMMQQMMQQSNANNSMGLLNGQQGVMGLNIQNPQQNQGLQGTFARGPLTEQQLRIRQQNILRASAEQQAMNSDAAQVSQTSLQSTGGGSDHSNRSSGNLVGHNNVGNDGNPFLESAMDASSSPLQRNSMGRPSSTQMPDMNVALNDSSTHSNSTRGGMSQQQSQIGLSSSGRILGQQPQKSFLDGNFAGGWQSNADLPDRRKVIFSILEVIKQMRSNSNTLSTK